jgi:aquaporin Z
MMIVLNSALRGSAGKVAPSAISMTVAFCIMSFGPVTDAAINPARTLGPAIGAGDYSQVLPYIIAQFVGAAVAAIAYRVILRRNSATKCRAIPRN